MQAHLCAFAGDFPRFVAAFLESERALSRNVREETITDLWVGAMLAMGRAGIHVDLPNEQATGADLELWFVSRNLDRSLGVLIQAKRAWCNHQRTSRGPFRRQCATKRLDRHSFRHLDHAGGRGKAKGSQASLLVSQRDADGHPIFPLYAFYVPEHARMAGSRVNGVVLADGHGVWSDIQGGLKKGSRTARTYKQIKKLQKHFLPLSALFCSGHSAVGTRDTRILEALERGKAVGSLLLFELAGGRIEYAVIPDPDDIARNLRTQIERNREVSGIRDCPFPVVRNGVPRDIAALTQGEPVARSFGEGEVGAAPRWRMVLRATFDPAEHEEEEGPNEG